MIFPLLITWLGTEDWSPLYRLVPGDVDARWRYNYAALPLKRTPLYQKITAEVEKSVEENPDLHALASISVGQFNRSLRMDHLARATLLNYYGYVATSRLDLLPPGWYENAWSKVSERLEQGQISKVDFSPNDYYLSRLRFLSDACFNRWLPIRQAGYRLYRFDPSEFRVASRLGWILVLSSKFERGIALEIVERLKRDRPNQWQTWSLAAHIYQWTGYYTNRKSYLDQALSSVNRALSFSDIPDQNLAGLKARKKGVEDDIRNGFKYPNGKPPRI
jgi:hypothetical protein